MLAITMSMPAVPVSSVSAVPVSSSCAVQDSRRSAVPGSSSLSRSLSWWSCWSDEAARSCVRVFVWVIRSPGTLRVFVPHPSSEPALLTGDFDFGVALRFFGLGFVN